MTTTRRIATALLVAGSLANLARAQTPQIGRTARTHRDLGDSGREVIHPGRDSARNVGSGNASELATYVVDKGKPLVVTAP